MAKASTTTTTLVTLVLTLEEAEALAVVLARVEGHWASPRRITNRISLALEDNGVDWYRSSANANVLGAVRFGRKTT